MHAAQGVGGNLAAARLPGSIRYGIGVDSMEGGHTIMAGATSGDRVLLCVAGLSPQVITETLYAIACEGEDALPQRVEVITTTEGARRAAQTLLGNQGGTDHFERLCTDYGLDRSCVDFGIHNIHVICDAQGDPLDDIVTEEDNAAAADLIHDRIRRLTASSRHLHVSLAGGRKTMGFYAGYSLSLYGRASDRLSHVLVNQPFESHPDFFYPPPHPVDLPIQRGEATVSTRDAEVRLADIPFVRMREELGESLPYEDLPYSEAVERAQAVLRPPELRVNLEHRMAWAQGHALSLSHTQFLWLVWLADRARRGEPPVNFDEDALSELEQWLDRLEGTGPNDLRDNIRKAQGDIETQGSTNYFDRNRSRLNDAIARSSGLPRRAVDRYRVQSDGRRGRTGYAIRLDPEQIHIEGEP